MFAGVVGLHRLPLCLVFACACSDVIVHSNDGTGEGGDTYCGPPDCCGDKPGATPGGCISFCNDGTWFYDCPCPGSAPLSGTQCNLTSFRQFSCRYDGPDCASSGTADCDDGVYTYDPDDCCPLELPEDGAPCQEDATQATCAYDRCGYISVARCQDGTFQAEDACDCRLQLTVSECEAISSCRYLEPACGSAESLGCFPNDPCTDQDCAELATCTVVTLDPPGPSCEALTRVCLE